QKEDEPSLVVSQGESLEEEEEIFDDEISLEEEEIVEDPIDPNVMPIDVPVADTTIDTEFSDPTTKTLIPQFDAPSITELGPLTQPLDSPVSRPLAGKDFEGRGKTQRQRAIGRDGASAESELAVEEALRWIAAHQGQQGNWDFALSRCVAACTCKNHGQGGAKNGATGLALLPFLGAG
ncbi:MAG: hypothetical protein MI757_20275, partial [Pirellulales bacterium]|nr:hypothetical protein [Pirellulales bacterium]